MYFPVRSHVVRTPRSNGVNTSLALTPHITSDDELYTMAHDLTAPTATIISISEMMLAGAHGPLSGAQAERITRIRRGAGYLLDLAGHLLAVPPRGERGSGLGLYIANELVRLHGGKIRVRTAPGWGSSFEVYLPAHVEL